jgi:hypothetical protein
MTWTQITQAQDIEPTGHLKISSTIVSPPSAQLKPPLTHLI